MKPEYIGINNFDPKNYVYAVCKCELPLNLYAIKMKRIPGKTIYHFKCDGCGVEGDVITKDDGGYR